MALIILPLHVWDRELDARILLISLLAGKDHLIVFGHEYNLAPLYKQFESIFHYGAGRPIYNEPRTNDWYEPIIELGGFNGLVFEEGLNDIDHSDKAMFLGTNTRSVNSTSTVYSWTSKEKKLLLNNTKPNIRIDLECKIKVCGNTRLELLGDIGKAYYHERTESLKNIFGRYILVSDNFGGIEMYGSKNQYNPKIDLMQRCKLEETNSIMQSINKKIQKSAYSRDAFCKIINQLIIERFAENYQNVNWEIITEENSKAIKFNNSKSDWIWLIDPLDGTKDFIQKTGEYAVHLALNFKNKPFIGIVVLPSLREIWFSVKDLGTWKESEEGPEENKKFKRFSNSKANTIVTSKNHSNEKLEIILKELNLKNIKRMGSIGFKVCSLLRNEADIYISISGKTAPKDWDLAAPNSLINSANCFFTNAAGKELTYNKENYEQKGCLVASTLQEREHFRICKEINKIIKKYNLIN